MDAILRIVTAAFIAEGLSQAGRCSSPRPSFPTAHKSAFALRVKSRLWAAGSPATYPSRNAAVLTIFEFTERAEPASPIFSRTRMQQERSRPESATEAKAVTFESPSRSYGSEGTLGSGCLLRFVMRALPE
jgi:hypothetical protein